MNIEKSSVTIYDVKFTDEEFKIISEGWVDSCYFSTYLWVMSEIESLMEDVEVYYETNSVKVTLSQDVPETLFKVIQEFLEKAEIY